MVVVVLTIARAVVSTLAGGVNGTNGAYTDAFGTNAGFNKPIGVAVDASGNVFVADEWNNCIRKVTAGGGTRIGPAHLRALAVRTSSRQHEREWIGRVSHRRSPRSHCVFCVFFVVSMLIPCFVRSFSPFGCHIFARCLSAMSMVGLTVFVFFAVLLASVVMVVLTGARAVVSTLAGSGNPAFADASGTNAAFSFPWGVAVDASGNVFVGDFGNHRIRKVTAGGGTRIGSVPLSARARCADIVAAAPARTGRASYS